LGPETAGPCIVAIDAPLVVTNPTGRRRCEGLISSVFNRSQAGAHSSNLGLPAFSKGVRAMELALRLGLAYDPAIEPGVETRRGLEVYPHPALVALFGLPLTLKYKAKPGRTVASRQAAFAELFRHLESLTAGFPAFEVTTSPRWAHLRDLVETGGSNAVLDRCEDEIDAYVCAYVALYYWTHGLAKCRVVGRPRKWLHNHPGHGCACAGARPGGRSPDRPGAFRFPTAVVTSGWDRTGRVVGACAVWILRMRLWCTGSSAVPPRPRCSP
jgi:predicted RNase H-like nuclease